MMGGKLGTVFWSIAVAVPFLLAGCMAGASCSGEQAYQGQSGVCNETNAFAYGGQVSGQTDVETYTWENTEGRAQVAWGGQSSSGSVTVTIQDASGQQVYRSQFGGGSYGPGGQSASSETTQSGDPGDWTIRIAFDGYTGQMGLSVQAR